MGHMSTRDSTMRGCKRVQEDTRGCERTRENARGCKRMQEEGCEELLPMECRFFQEQNPGAYELGVPMAFVLQEMLSVKRNERKIRTYLHMKVREGARMK